MDLHLGSFLNAQPRGVYTAPGPFSFPSPSGWLRRPGRLPHRPPLAGNHQPCGLIERHRIGDVLGKTLGLPGPHSELPCHCRQLGDRCLRSTTVQARRPPGFPLSLLAAASF